MRYIGPLATAEQIDAERRAIALFNSPAVRALRPRLRQILEEDPAAAIPAGAAEIDHALDLWTMALIMWKVGGDTATPVILWHVENMPHSWFGHDMPGMGAAGDNPDHIYRGAFLDGASTYEIKGRFGASRPAQFSFEIFHGSPGKTFRTDQTSRTPDLGNQVSLLKADDMRIEGDGSFTLIASADAPAGAANHLKLAHGPMQMAIRDVLSDWAQEPTTLSIRRIDGPSLGSPPTEKAMVEDIIADLPDFVAFWSSFKTNWLGGIADNKMVGPAPRAGGWGYLLGGRYNLAEEQAITLTVDDCGASYLGFQLLSPWLMMAEDARKRTVSFNNAQMARNPDGTVTFVLSARDPGVANWIDTGSLLQGMYILRWQGVPAGADPKRMLRDFRVVEYAAIEREIPAFVPRLDIDDRREQVARRKVDFERRLGAPIARE
jgi:hypothetical protein